MQLPRWSVSFAESLVQLSFDDDLPLYPEVKKTGSYVQPYSLAQLANLKNLFLPTVVGAVAVHGHVA